MAMISKKHSKLTLKGISTVNELLSKDSVKGFLNVFMEKHLVDTESIILIFGTTDGEVNVGICGEDDTLHLLGMVDIAHFDILHRGKGNDEETEE